MEGFELLSVDKSFSAILTSKRRGSNKRAAAALLLISDYVICESCCCHCRHRGNRHLFSCFVYALSWSTKSALKKISMCWSDCRRFSWLAFSSPYPPLISESQSRHDSLRTGSDLIICFTERVQSRVSSPRRCVYSATHRVFRHSALLIDIINSCYQ